VLHFIFFFTHFLGVHYGTQLPLALNTEEQADDQTLTKLCVVVIPVSYFVQIPTDTFRGLSF
jgi:hypothetical protein